MRVVVDHVRNRRCVLVISSVEKRSPVFMDRNGTVGTQTSCREHLSPESGSRCTQKTPGHCYYIDRNTDLVGPVLLRVPPKFP